MSWSYPGVTKKPALYLYSDERLEYVTASLYNKYHQLLEYKAMPMAVGVIETQGFPAVLAAADAMVKAAAVTIVYYGLAESARMLVAVRGHTAEVRRAVEAGIEAGNQSNGGHVITHYIVPNPPENVETILPIHFTQKSEPFRI